MINQKPTQSQIEHYSVEENAIIQLKILLDFPLEEKRTTVLKDLLFACGYSWKKIERLQFVAAKRSNWGKDNFLDARSRRSPRKLRGYKISATESL